MANFVFIDDGRIRPAPGTRVIKAADYAAIGPAIKVFDQACTKADEIVREAKEVYQSEKERGYQQGLQEAKKEMAMEMTAMALRIDQYYRDMEQQTIRLVMEIVNKVIQGVDLKQRVVGQVKNALTPFKGCKHLTIKAGPDVADMVKRHLSEFTDMCPGIAAIDVKPVPGMPSDNIVLESGTCIVEASVDAQLEAIENAIQDELKLPN